MKIDQANCGMDARSESYPSGTTITPPAMSLRNRKGTFKMNRAIFTGSFCAINFHGASWIDTSPSTSKKRFTFVL